MNIINAFVIAVAVSLTSQLIEPRTAEPVAIVPFEMIGSHITVYASVNGSEAFPFTFDTGGATGLVDSEVAQRIGMKETSRVPGMGAGGVMQYSISSGNTIEMGGLTFRNNDLVMTNLSHMKQFGKQTAGVLGYHQIAGYVVKIDYDANELHFYNKRNYQYTGEGTIVPIGLELRIPSVDAEVELSDGTHIKGRFLLDTGAALYGSMNSPTVSKYDALKSLEKSYQVEAAGTTGTFKTTNGRVKAFTIAGHTFSNSPFMFSEANQGATADPNYIGLIGNNLAGRFNIILDYANERMILEPNAAYRATYRVNASGLSIRVNEEDQLEIHQVFKDSPADNLGMKKGDVLTAMNNKAYAGKDRGDVRAMLQESGKKVKLSWQRGSESMEGELTLKSII